MPEQKTHTSLLLAIAGIIVVGGIAGYYFLHHSTTPQSNTNTFPVSTQIPNDTSQSTNPQNTPTEDSSAASATLDPSSLSSTSHTPTITGTYANTTGLELLISRGTLPKSGLMSAAMPDVLWDDRSDHGGALYLSGLASGNFSSSVTTPLPDGTYVVGVYIDTFHYPRTDQNMALDFRTLLAGGTLTIHSGN